MFERPRVSILQLLIFSFAIGGLVDAEAHQEALLNKEALLLKAERLFSEQSYDDALVYYSDIALRQPEEQNPLREALLSRMAACHLGMNRPLNALNTLLKKNSPLNRPIELYLLGRIYGKLGKFAEGVDLLSLIPSELGDSTSLLALEKGVLFSQLGDLSSAKTILQNIPFVETAPHPFLLAQLQLAKNCLSTQDWEEAQNILSVITVDIRLPASQKRENISGGIIIHGNRGS